MSTTRQSQRIKQHPRRFDELPNSQSQPSTSAEPSTSTQPQSVPEEKEKSLAKRGRKRTRHNRPAADDEFTFETLMDYPSVQSPDSAPTVQTWKKAFDEYTKTVIFYQLDVRSDFPGISRCIRVRPEVDGEVSETGQPKLIASVFMGDYDLGTEPVLSLLDKHHISSESEFCKVLEFIGSMPVVRSKTGIKRREIEDGIQEAAQPVVYKSIVKRSRLATQRLSSTSNPPDTQLASNERSKQTETVDNIAAEITTQKDTSKSLGFYWKEPGPEQTQLLEGHDLYVKNSVLNDLRNSLSCTANVSSPTTWKSYAWNLTLHLLGDAEGVGRLKCRAKKLTVDQLLDESDIKAIIEHVRNVCAPEDSDLENSYKRYCNGLLQQLGVQRKPRPTRINTRARYAPPIRAIEKEPSPKSRLLSNGPQHLEILGTLQGKALCPVKQCAVRKYAAADLAFMKRHFQQAHEDTHPLVTFSLHCPVADCAASFGISMDAFREHIAAEHARTQPNGANAVVNADNAFPSGIVEEPHEQEAENETTLEAIMA